MRVAVVAHRRKSLGGGLVELRRVLASFGINDPLWFEVDKSCKAPKRVRRAVAAKVDLVFVWGGDGTVQRCLDVLAGTGIPMAVLPAGTANLFATNLGIPDTVADAVAVGLEGQRRTLDVGRVNGERFGVMAGVGADALMIRDADRGLKDRLGRAAYVWTGARNLGKASAQVRVDVDGEPFYRGHASCVLVGNVGRVFGGITAFDDATPDDGRLDVAVVTADSAVQWGKVIARVSLGKTAKSPHILTTSAKRVDLRLKPKQLYQLDGGDRAKAKRIAIEVEPAALVVCVPDEAVAS